MDPDIQGFINMPIDRVPRIQDGFPGQLANESFHSKKIENNESLMETLLVCLIRYLGDI